MSNPQEIKHREIMSDRRGEFYVRKRRKEMESPMKIDRLHKILYQAEGCSLMLSKKGGQVRVQVDGDEDLYDIFNITFDYNLDAVILEVRK